MSRRRWDAWSLTNWERNGAKGTTWARAGAAFENRDGSIAVQLDVVPLSGRIQLRDPSSDHPQKPGAK